MSKIIADNDYCLNAFNPAAMARNIATRVRERRLELNLTQNSLADKAGVSLGSLKRFENSYEISLKHLLMISIVLDSTEEFDHLFTKPQYQSIDEALKGASLKNRKRGSRHD